MSRLKPRPTTTLAAQRPLSHGDSCHTTILVARRFLDRVVLNNNFTSRVSSQGSYCRDCGGRHGVQRGIQLCKQRRALTKLRECVKRRVFIRRQVGAVVLMAMLVLALWPCAASAHNVSKRDASFVQANRGAAVGAFMYLGAKHMVTGYDHILFLVGVIFFLYRLKDIVQYVSLFTLGHSTTLLLGVFGHVRANPFLIDAIIALSVVYKAFDNMGGFQRFLGFEPNTKLAVLVFGLFHGFGLATKLQELTLSQTGLVTNIISFNVGVEIGQVLALSVVLIGLSYWRMQGGFLKHAFATNTALMTGGFILLSYQLAGYLAQ